MEVQKTDSNNFRFVKATEGQDMDITMHRKVVKEDSNLAGLDAFVGDWVAESENGTRRTWSFSWDVTHRVLNNQMIQYKQNGEVAWALNAIVGWDQENERLVNWGRGDTGQSADFFWSKLADGTWHVKAASGNRTWNFSHKDDLFHNDGRLNR